MKRFLLLTIATITLSLTSTACTQNDNGFEEVGESIDESVEEVQDEVDDATDSR